MFYGFQCLDFLIILKQFVTIVMSDNNEIRGITTTDSQSTREIDCLCFIKKNVNKACFCNRTTILYFPLIHGIIIRVCMFGVSFLYNVYALLWDLLCLKIITESNSFKMIKNRVLINVRLHVKCLNTSTYISLNVPLIHTELWTDYWLVYALIGQRNRAT